jgi:hypothetical protein
MSLTQIPSSQLFTAVVVIDSEKSITNKTYNQRKLNLGLLKVFLVKENPTNVYLQYNGIWGLGPSFERIDYYGNQNSL